MSPEVPVTKKINYSGNSNVDRAAAAEETVKETPKLKKIEGLKVTQTKKTIGSRLAASFGGQNMKTVGMVLLTTVVVPQAKDLLMDLINEGGNRMIYGDTTPRANSSSIGSRLRGTNYNSISRTPLVGSGSRISTISSAVSNEALSARQKANFDFSTLLIHDRAKAEEVIHSLVSAVDQFGMVTVADFYDALEITGNGFTDATYAWKTGDLDFLEAKRVRNGYILNLPQPRPID